MADNLSMKNIWELHDYSFTIPYQQRGYKWTEYNIINLLQDLTDYISSGKGFYCLQPIAIVPIDKSSNHYSIIDGQQRLTTIYLLYKFLFSSQVNLTKETELYHYEYERDVSDERKNLLLNKIDNIDDKTIDAFYITRAYKTLEDWFKNNKNKIDEFKKLIKNELPEKSLQIIWYIVEKEKSHAAFRNINSGKIQLTNMDLIKALLLNRENSFQNRDQIAAQFELMERQFEEDRFWYMFKNKDVDRQKGQTRMDLLFNFVLHNKIKDIDEEYQNEPRLAFFELSKLNDDDLQSEWKKLRELFQRLKDLFDDPYTFHYVGFLNYCSDNKLKEILLKNKELNKSAFIRYLKNSIKSYVSKKHIEDYCYGETQALRRIFVLHNVETILQRYQQLQELKNLRFSFEYFPFELLYKQTWHIEHIASHTDNDLKSKIDRKDWLESIRADYPDIFTDEISKLETVAGDLLDDKKFENLYKKIISTDKIQGILKDSIKDESDKNSIGNLVLLDAHTNTSFHNSLFPRKRKIVILASGLKHNEKSKDEVPDVQSVYVPICTQQVYTKAYNKNSDVTLNEWTKVDFDYYLADMQEKLSFYFGEKQ